MGSDDGRKSRRSSEWYGAAACLCVVGPLLLFVHRMAKAREPVKSASLRGSASSLGGAAERASPLSHGSFANVTSAVSAMRRVEATAEESRTAPVKAIVVEPARPRTSLREILVAAARRPPRDVVAWLKTDPLGVEDVNVTTWQCPPEGDHHRLLPASKHAPSPAAAAAMRDGTPGAAFVWFEHLSKAGGTSFCAFVRKNVGFQRTPPYYCMPSDGAFIKGTDGRVGTWPGDQLEAYVARTKHAVVANEWDAFPASMLASTFLDRAVLTTVVRDPIDRLVSAYKFWGVLHNPSPKKPALLDWLQREDASSRVYPIRKFKHNFASQVGRNNFATWKFSAELDPRFDDCPDAACLAESFDAALENLERFHIVAPTKWQAHAGPLWRQLGFQHLDEVHIVPSGKIQDSKSDGEIDDANIATLREKNALDYLLWAWVRRAFLERLKCPPVTALPTSS